MTKDPAPRFRIGTAGWSIGSALAEQFAADGSALTRYASVMSCAEINSSFYRPHKPETYGRWADSVPDDFRFSVKLPKAISHQARLQLSDDSLEKFAAQICRLGEKLGAVLVQLPPHFAFDAEVVAAFVEASARAWSAPTLFEPRHASWFAPAAQTLLAQLDIPVVGADPAIVPAARSPTVRRGPAYWRLHGSPRIYYSAYSGAQIETVAAEMRSAAAAECWCIFDNTAQGEALKNALTLHHMLSHGS